MLKSTYDPTNINLSAFDRNNHVGFQEPVKISSPTNLTVGGKYLSTATATHQVPAAGNQGDLIFISWLKGTIMTLNSTSDIVITKDANYTDTNWVFNSFIQDLTLYDNGTQWEIK